MAAPGVEAYSLAMSSQPRALDDWLDRFFASYDAHRPVNATFIGRHRLDHLLPDFSEEGAGDALADMDALLREGEGIDTDGASDTASDTGRLDLRLARGFLRIQRWEYGSLHFHRGNPCVYTGEAAFGILSLFLSDFAPLAERVASAEARLRAVPRLLASCRENIRRAPPAWTERAVRECRGALALLRRGLPGFLSGQGFGGGSLETALDAAAGAFSELRDWMERDLLWSPTDGYACGEEALRLYLREGHFLSEGPDEIVSYARERLAEASRALDRRSRELGYADPESALAALAERHPPVDEYYGAYQATWDVMRSAAEAHGLVTWPEFPIRFVARPEWAREAAPDLYFLFYRSPAAFRRPAVHDHLVTPIDASMPADEQRRLLRATNDSVIKLNHVIHHGGIGHHVQNWNAFRAASRVGQVAAVDCASRIAMFCGGTMAEGWACYATDLMAEFGALTPLELLAELAGRRRMCCRAIVDVELHRGRMSLDDAVALYREEAGMSEAAARSEAVKNSMFPGAALMYLVGTDGIHDLRRKVMSRLGKRFSLRRFHDELLAYGSVPVSLIAEDMIRRAPDAA